MRSVNTNTHRPPPNRHQRGSVSCCLCSIVSTSRLLNQLSIFFILIFLVHLLFLILPLLRSPSLQSFIDRLRLSLCLLLFNIILHLCFHTLLPQSLLLLSHSSTHCFYNIFILLITHFYLFPLLFSLVLLSRVAWLTPVEEEDYT